MPDAHKLPQILRMVGYYLDRKEARTFTIFVSGHLLMIWYETSGGHKNERVSPSKICMIWPSTCIFEDGNAQPNTSQPAD